MMAARREEEQGESGGKRILSVYASIVRNCPILYSTASVRDRKFVLAEARARERG